MLDTNASNLWLEIQAAERFRDAHLSRVQELKEKYGGIGYMDQWAGDWSENHPHQYIKLTTGKVIFNNPRVRVNTRRPGTQRFIAQAMTHGHNRWMRDIELQKTLKNVYVTQNFGFGVIQTVSEPQPWADPRDPSVYHWPACYEIQPDRFFFDPFAFEFRHARYSGHKFVRDKEDLMDEAEDNPSSGWDRDAIASLSSNQGIEDLPERDDTRGQSLDRNEIVCYELWVPEHRMQDPKDGFHGTIFTVAIGGQQQESQREIIDGSSNNRSTDTKATYIRAPRAYYGPRWGPYTLFGVYPMPGDPFPLSPLSAAYGQMRELNDMVTASNTAIRDYKRIIIVDADNPDLVRKIKDSPDATVIPVKGFTPDSVKEVELRGITEQHIKQIDQALQRADRNIGIHEAQRSGLGTAKFATEIAQAQKSADDAIAFVKQEFTQATIQVLNTAGWYMYHDDRVVFPLGPEAAQDMGMTEPWFYGGEQEDGSGARYDDLELEIEPYSMEMTNEALMRAQYTEMMQLAINAAQLIPMTPYYDWEMLFNKGGEMQNDPSFGEFYDPQIAAQVQGMMAEQMAAQEPRAEFSKQQGGVGKPAKLLGNQTGAQMSGLTKKLGV